jgi:broad specificity phosphatase PhoE
MKKAIYFVRHAQTEWNSRRLFQGHTDIPLNEAGRKEAENLRLHLRSVSFVRAYASDLSRAQETAEIITKDSGLEVACDLRLREKNYGTWEGKPVEEFQCAPESEQNEGEPWLEVQIRMMAFFQDLVAQDFEGNALVVSHAGALKRLISELLEIPVHNLHLSNASYCKLLHAEGSWYYAEGSASIILSIAEKIAHKI